MTKLTKKQQDRYIRNTIIEEIGESGQAKLLKSNILIIGAGGLGSAAIFYLAANGVGNITVIDCDKVEISNLQRQIIHNASNINQEKVISAKQKVNLLNDDVNFKALNMKIDEINLKKIVADFDYIIDCTDNFLTRFIINQACHIHSKVLISAAVKNFSGQLAVFKSYLKNKPCYSCFNIYAENSTQELPLNEKGILGSIPGIMGSMQASVTINEILGIGNDLSGKMLICDFLKFSFRTVKINKNPTCKICSK